MDQREKDQLIKSNEELKNNLQQEKELYLSKEADILKILEEKESQLTNLKNQELSLTEQVCNIS